MTRVVARTVVETGLTPEQVGDLDLSMFVAIADFVHERMELNMAMRLL